MSRILIVDGDNLMVRSAYAMRNSGLSVEGGEIPTGPLLAFVNTLTHHMRSLRPEQMVVCWDNPYGSRRRKGLDQGYKANRHLHTEDPDKIQFLAKQSITRTLCQGFLEFAGIAQDVQDGFESDDLIARYRRNIENEALGDEGEPPVHTVTVLSSDKDFLMLLNDTGLVRVDQVRLGSSGVDTDYWDADRVRSEYGCEPSSLRYAMALAGDVSDGVQGLPRVGMKTAIKYLGQADWVFEGGVLDHPKVAPYADRARTNLALVDLIGIYENVPTKTHLPPPFVPPAGDALNGFRDFLQWTQLRSVEDLLDVDRLW